MEREKAAEEIFWQSADTGRFWGQIARNEHILQVYNSEDDLIKTLFDFANDAFQNDEAFVMIATPKHLSRLEDKLGEAGHSIFNLKLRQQYISIDASVALEDFMFNGTPDPILFHLVVSTLVKRAKKDQRPVRAYGEMVSMLWKDGNSEAALRLEELWNDYMQSEPITLLCGYPASIPASEPERFAEVHHNHRRCLCGHQTEDQKVLFRAL